MVLDIGAIGGRWGQREPGIAVRLVKGGAGPWARGAPSAWGDTSVDGEGEALPDLGGPLGPEQDAVGLVHHLRYGQLPDEHGFPSRGGLTWLPAYDTLFQHTLCWDQPLWPGTSPVGIGPTAQRTGHAGRRGEGRRTSRRSTRYGRLPVVSSGALRSSRQMGTRSCTAKRLSIQTADRRPTRVPRICSPHDLDAAAATVLMFLALGAAP